MSTGCSWQLMRFGAAVHQSSMANPRVESCGVIIVVAIHSLLETAVRVHCDRDHQSMSFCTCAVSNPGLVILTFQLISTFWIRLMVCQNSRFQCQFMVRIANTNLLQARATVLMYGNKRKILHICSLNV